ncbi:MAG: cytochrome c [Alphaproteobacteria bacterium]|nr:cytochrome c [Alphaproteobacteria bacterium]MBM3651334.1 cytochrome c [Alphaproteobacteria bacterium]
MRRFAPLAVASCLLFAVDVARAKSPEASLLNRGRAIAQQNCGRCHAVGAKGDSANPKSPPFRLLARKYPLSNLEEALAEGIVVGHEGLEMPQFRLSVAQIEALLAYLKSIQR